MKEYETFLLIVWLLYSVFGAWIGKERIYLFICIN